MIPASNPHFGALYFTKTKQSNGPERVSATITKDVFGAVTFMDGDRSYLLGGSPAVQALSRSISENSMEDTVAVRNQVKELVANESGTWKFDWTGHTPDTFKKMVNDSLDDYTQVWDKKVGQHDSYVRNWYVPTLNLTPTAYLPIETLKDNQFEKKVLKASKKHPVRVFFYSKQHHPDVKQVESKISRHRVSYQAPPENDRTQCYLMELSESPKTQKLIAKLGTSGFDWDMSQDLTNDHVLAGGRLAYHDYNATDFSANHNIE